MVCEYYKVKVPGSLMLFGEHAVLNNKRSLVAAVNKYVKMQLIPRLDREIHIISSLSAEHIVGIDKFKITKPYSYVLTAINEYLSKISYGFDLKIEADFTADVGFGSSAAVTVGTLVLLMLWLKEKEIDLFKLHELATKVVRQVQEGMGSGADVAASIFGGVVAYRVDPLTVKKFDVDLPIVVIYSGRKIPTAEVVSEVKRTEKQFPQTFSHIYEAIDACTQEAILCLKNNLDLYQLGALMNIHHGLQASLMTSNNVLELIVNGLRSCNDHKLKEENYIYGAKISGSGLGDCVVGLGYLSNNQFPQDQQQKDSGIKQFTVSISNEGITY